MKNILDQSMEEIMQWSEAPDECLRHALETMGVPVQVLASADFAAALAFYTISVQAKAQGAHAVALMQEMEKLKDKE